MSSVAKATTWIVVLAIAAMVGIGSQVVSRTSAASVSLTEAELSLFADKQLRPMDKARFATDPQARKEFLEQVEQFLALAAEAQRLGLQNTEKTRVMIEIGEAQALAEAYVEKHAQEFGPQGPQFPPEEIEAWKAAHAADIERYLRVAREISPMQAPQPDDIAQLFVLAERARKEGLQNEPWVALQLKLARYQALAQAMQERIVEEAEVTDAQVAEQYAAMSARGDLDQLRVAHVLVATEPLTPGAPPVDEAAARQKAEEVLARARAGENFGQLAAQYSDDPGSKTKGGEYELDRFTNFVPEFKEAAYKLKPGEISGLVKTDFGYHIITVLERKPPQPLTPQTQERFKQYLVQKQQEDIVEGIAKRNDVDLPEDFTVEAPAQTGPMMNPHMLPPPGAGDQVVVPEEGGGAPPQPQAQPTRPSGR